MGIARRRTALKRLGRNFFRQHAGRSRRMAQGSRGRQNRAVLAPVAGVKLMEIVGPDRAFGQSSIHRRRRPEGIRLRGERGISRKTTAQGRPGVPAHLRSAVCILAHDCGCHGHPAFPAPSISRGQTQIAQLRARRAARSHYRIPRRPHPSKTAMRASEYRHCPTLSAPVATPDRFSQRARTDNLPSFHYGYY